jgi:hypothetical protein
VNGTRFFAAASPMNAARLGRAGEGDATYARVSHEGGADLVAETLHEVEDARWEAGLGDEVHQHRAAER